MTDELFDNKLDEVEVAAQDMVIDDVKVDEAIPMNEEEAWAYKIIRRAASLRGVTINRETF